MMNSKPELNKKEKFKALDLAIGTIEKQFGKGSIIFIIGKQVFLN